jgi:hypothetical protein
LPHLSEVLGENPIRTFGFVWKFSFLREKSHLGLAGQIPLRIFAARFKELRR